MADDPQLQPYDTALKSLLEDHVAEMLPELVPETEFIREQPPELNRTKLLPDQVYLVLHYGEHHILNMELQTTTDPNMAYRMFLYHVGLLEKYRLPVLSVVIYPFETKVPEPVFREKNAHEVLLEFPHRVLCLWTLDAASYLRRQLVSMYTLLPGMKGTNAALLLQAIEEMKERYSEPHLARHLVRFKTILHRSTMLSAQDKQFVEEHLYTYDSLLDEDPEIQERIVRAKIQAEIRGQQKILLDFIEVRFPTLLAPARHLVAQLNNSNDLSRLMKQFAVVPDEATARWLLGTYQD